MTTTGPILVLSDQPFIAALVGLLLELAGHRPVFAAANEPPADALDRQRPVAVIVMDAEMDAARSDLLFALAARRSVGVVVFGAEARMRMVGEIAAARQIPWCTMPASAERLSAAISASLSLPERSVRGGGDRRRAATTTTSDGARILHDAGGFEWVVYDRRVSSERRAEENSGLNERVFVREDGETRRCDVTIADATLDETFSALEQQLARATPA